MPCHSDWAKLKLRLKESYATTRAAKRRQRAPNHSDCAKPKLGLREGYATIGAAESARECRAIQIGPNLSWDWGKAMEPLLSAEKRHSVPGHSDWT